MNAFMYVLTAGILGLAVGIFCMMQIQRIRMIGFLRIDRSIPEEPPYLFLEALQNVEDISKRKYVVFKVKNENFIAQEKQVL